MILFIICIRKMRLVDDNVLKLQIENNKEVAKFDGFCDKKKHNLIEFQFQTPNELSRNSVFKELNIWPLAIEQVFIQTQLSCGF